MKYVVTGGAGFIGSNLVKLLVNEGHSVKVIDNYTRGNNNNLESILEKIDVKKIDICNYDQLKFELNDIDGIFHHAALTSVSESFLKLKEYENVNVKGTENIFKLAHENDFKVILASSASVYGDTKNMPISEDEIKNPINPYGLTKLQDEYLAEKYHKLGTCIISLRYFNVYGRNQNPDYAGVITKFLNNIFKNKNPLVFGNGLQKRDFIFVEDVAQANLKAMSSQTEFAFLNIGTGIATSILDLANMMIKLSKKTLIPEFDKLPEGDVEISQASTNKAKELINWKFTTDIEKGLSYFFDKF